MTATINLTETLLIAVLVMVTFAVLAVIVGRDAQTRGRNGWGWGMSFLLFPIPVGFAYLLLRRRQPIPWYSPWVPDEAAGETSVYRMYRWWRIQVTATMALFAIIAVFLIWASATGRSGPGWGFTAFWVFAVVLGSYSFLWRMAYELELRDDLLRWRTPLRSGSVRVSDIRELRPYFWGPNAEIIELADGTKVWVMVQKGFREFAEDLAQRSPGLPVRVSDRFVKMAERWPGARSGYDRRDR